VTLSLLSRCDTHRNVAHIASDRVHFAMRIGEIGIAAG
jgi:hypothetical protein